MGSVSEEETSDEERGSPSADVSGSETSADFSGFLRFPASASSATAASGSSPVKPAAAAAFFLDGKQPQPKNDSSEVEMMRERFAKLLLGEDMSGSGQGVCTALAISNAITNLSATVFGELWRLEPLAQPKKSLWFREMDWLLSISDSILELFPSVQEFPGGGTFEVMISRQRSDLHLNLPALKKLDAMLIGMLDGFIDTEFCYVDRGILVADEENDVGGSLQSSFRKPSLREEDKWWLPCPRVPPNGLSEEGRKKLQQSRDCANQILKAAMAINSGVLSEMEIPHAYLETLPKSGKSCLGEIIYRYIIADQFSPECLLDSLDLSSEHYTLEIANRFEAAVYMWRLRDWKEHPLHSKSRKSWSGKVMGLVTDSERNKVLAQRAETLLQIIRHRYPCLPQTVLDMNKIQYNKDVGQAILESYSRVMESLAFNIIARIDDLIFVDDATKRSSVTEEVPLFNRGGFGGLPIQKKITPSPFSVHNTPYVSPFATPAYCSSPISGSPERTQISLSTYNHHVQMKKEKLEKPISGDVEKALWSYIENINSRKDTGDAPERDQVQRI